MIIRSSVWLDGLTFAVMDGETVADLLRNAAEALERARLCFGHGTDNALDEAAALVAHATGGRDELTEDRLARRASEAEKRALQGILRRRIDERVPAAYLIGRTHFAGMEFKVDARALVPRSPIGELVERSYSPWVDAAYTERVLDLCTGCGCIAVATAAHLPRATVDAVDLSPAALALASENVLRHGVGDRVRLIRSDLFRGIAGERYDLIVTNPPYVGTGEYENLPPEYRHEPSEGLLAPDDGLAVTLRILASAPDHLARGGRLIGEVGHGHEALQERLPEVPFVWLELERGGEGVFLLEGDALATAAAGAARELHAAREGSAGKAAR